MLIDNMTVFMLNGMDNVPDIVLIRMGWIIIVNASDCRLDREFPRRGRSQDYAEDPSYALR